MRYTLLVRADRKDLVEAVLAKLPSHYIKDSDGVGQPVGRLATLVPYGVTDANPVPAYYVCSGECNADQVAALKAAMVATKLLKGATWKEADGEDGKESLIRASKQ